MISCSILFPSTFRVIPRKFGLHVDHFYWPVQVVPGRMAMLITLFLVLINIFNIVTTNSPNVEGMTAIAAWMLVCIFFVFGALGNIRRHLVACLSFDYPRVYIYSKTLACFFKENSSL